jgi:glycosyltransferase involved in cell wall biosynthesis
MIVDVFSKLDYPLVVIGDGPELEKLRVAKTPNIDILGWQPDDVVRDMLGRAKAFVHVAEEDFGIAPVEAQAAGCPVIAYSRGGVLETIIPGKTGFFFSEQNVASLGRAIEDYASGTYTFITSDLIENAMRFRRERFDLEFANFVERSQEEFMSQSQLPIDPDSDVNGK